ncbi:nucleotidyltransferase domain-containing protein [bacterium]|nr:nucleotidyltransferase domain-containing protein [bacterium]
MVDGLKERYRNEIVNVLSANPAVEKAVLFGSRALGTHSPTSDIDLAIFGENLTLNDLSDLSQKMERLSIPQHIDLLLFDRIENPKLREHIQKQGIALSI